MLWLKPIKGDKNDNIRYNIGFSMSNGILDKLASTEVAEKKPDCIKWAGKCKFSRAAKILEEYKDKIREAQQTCNSKYATWKNNNKMSPIEFQQWDSSKGPDTCPKSPPDDENDTSYQNTITCTTQGCDLEVWGLWDKDKDTGTVYQSKTDYEEARERLIGEKCAKQIKDEYENAKPPFTNPSSAGISLSECQYDNYWFIDGENKGSEEEWKKGMCDKRKKGLLTTTHSGPVEYCGSSPVYICGGEELTGDNAQANFDTCIANDKDAQCTQALNNDAVSRGNGGPYTSPTPEDMLAPIGKDCGETYWYCSESGKIHREPGSREKYETDKDCEQACKPRDATLCSIFKSPYWCCKK